MTQIFSGNLRDEDGQINEYLQHGNREIESDRLLSFDNHQPAPVPGRAV
jgi:hypothetical protein